MFLYLLVNQKNMIIIIFIRVGDNLLKYISFILTLLCSVLLSCKVRCTFFHNQTPPWCSQTHHCFCLACYSSSVSIISWLASLFCDSAAFWANNCEVLQKVKASSSWRNVTFIVVCSFTPGIKLKIKRLPEDLL